MAATPPTQNNFGPEGNLNLQLATIDNGGRSWEWVCFVKVKPGKTIQFSFQFSAFHENEIILHNYPSWIKTEDILRVNNYFFELPGHAWEYTNTSAVDTFIALTAWHKNSPPNPNESWWQNPMEFDDSQENTLEVRFADNWHNTPFHNAVAVIYRTAREDCTPLHQTEIE